MFGNHRNQKEAVLEHLVSYRAQQQIEKRQTQKQLSDLLTRKNYQISILHEVNSRLGTQLSLLQKKMGIDPNIILKELENLGQFSVAFHYETQQLQYLDSLLRSYDQNSIRQKKIIAVLYSQLQDAEKKSENLIRQNSFLLTEMQQKCKQILQIYSKGFPQDNLVSSYNKLQLQSENQRINTIREENQYLVKNYNELEVKYQKIMIQLDQAEEVADKYFNGFKSQTEELKDALIRIDDLSKIKQVLEKKFDEISQQNIELETTKNKYQTKINRLQTDHKSLKNQLLALKKNSRQQVQKLNTQIDTFKMENQTSSKRQRQIFQKSMAMEHQLDSIKQSYRKAKRELQKSQSDFQQTLKMCEAYQTKINHLTKKQDNIKLVVEEHKQRLSDVLLQRDKAKLKEQQLEKLIDNINSKHKDQLDTLKKTFQKIIYQQKQRIRELQDSRQQFQNNVLHGQITLKNQVQKLKRENNILRDENNKFLTNIRFGSENEIVTRIKQLQQKNQTLTKLLNQKQRVMRDEIEHKDDLIRNLESENRDLSRQVDKERVNSRQAINERTQYRSKISILEKEKDCLEDQIGDLTKKLNSKFLNNEEQRDWKIRELQQKLEQAINKEKNTRQKAIEMLQKYDEAEINIKNQYQNRIRQLQTQNINLRRKLSK